MFSSIIKLDGNIVDGDGIDTLLIIDEKLLLGGGEGELFGLFWTKCNMALGKIVFSEGEEMVEEKRS